MIFISFSLFPSDPTSYKINMEITAKTWDRVSSEFFDSRTLVRHIHEKRNSRLSATNAPDKAKNNALVFEIVFDLDKVRVVFASDLFSRVADNVLSVHTAGPF